MEVANNKVVSVIYELRTKSADGEIAEIADESRPLTFIAGIGNLLPLFESQLTGKQVNDSFQFSIPSKDAYGERNESAIIDVPLNAFIVNGEIDYEMVRIGHTVPMRDQQGQRLNGIVKNISDTAVTMDFNHPLAGEDLYFSGKIIAIRDATEEELAHGHIHSSCHSDDEGGCGDCCSGGCCGE